MDRKTVLQTLMFVLAVAIIGILVAEPMMSQEIMTLDYVTEDELWNFSETTTLNYTALSQDQERPAVQGDVIVWQEGVGFGIPPVNRDIYAYNVTNETYFVISNQSGVREECPDIWGDIVAWQDDSNPVTLIYYYNIQTDNKSQIQWTWSRASFGMPKVWNGIIVYQDDNTNCYMHDIATNTTTTFVGLHPVDDVCQHPYIHEDKIVYERYDDGTNETWEIWLYDIGTATNTKLVGGRDCQYPTVYDDIVVYHTWIDGDWKLEYYDLSEERTYTMFSDDPDRKWYPVVYEDEVIFTDQSGGLNQMAIVDLDFNLWEETKTLITNDTIIQQKGDIDEDIIVWYEVSHEVLEFDNIKFITHISTEEILIPEIATRTTYDLDWIFAFIILVFAFVGIGAYYVNKYYMEE